MVALVDNLTLLSKKSFTAVFTAEVRRVPIVLDARWLLPIMPRLSIEVGAGGGLLIGWGRADAFAAAPATGVQPTGIGAGHAALHIDLGPGQIVARVRAQLSTPFSGGAVDHVNPSSASLTVGYRWAFGN